MNVEYLKDKSSQFIYDYLNINNENGVSQDDDLGALVRLFVVVVIK